MERFAGWVIRARYVIVGLVVVLTILAGWCVVRYTRVEADISKYLPTEDPVVVAFNEAGKRFGGVAVATVALESDDIFTSAGLRTVADMTRAFALVDGVTWVLSLTNVDDVQRVEEDGEVGVLVKKLVSADSLPADAEELARLRRHVLGSERLVGTVISADGRVANLLVHISATADRVEVARQLERRARQLAGGRRLYFSGFPFWMKTLTDSILGDMVVLVPIVILVIIVVLFLSFGTVRGVLLPLVTVVISATWAMGLMAALDIPITTLSNTIPVLLIALGTAYAIHLLHKYNEVIDAGRRDAGAIRAALSDVMVPIGLAGLTTVVGFISFQTSSLLFIRQTGLIAAFGIFSAMLVAVTFLPALLSWLPPRSGRRRRRYEPASGGDRLLGWVGKRRWTILSLSGGVAAVGALLLPRLDRSFDMIAYFPAHSEVRRADEMMRTRLGGSVPLWITVEGPVKHPFALKTMRLVEKYLRSLPQVHHARSIAAFLAEINRVLNGYDSIPATSAGVGNLWLQVEGKDVLGQLVDPGGRHALVRAVCASADTAVLRRIVSQVDAFLQTVPLRAQAVDRRSAPAQLRKQAEQAELQRVAMMLRLDMVAAGAGEELPAPEQLRDWLRKQLHEPAHVDRQELVASLQAFFLSDESDLEFPDTELAARAARAVAASGNGEPDAGKIARTLAEVLPRQVVAADPEALGFLARSVVSRWQQRRRRIWIDRVAGHLLQRLPGSLAQRLHLRDDLRGDLSELTQPVFYLPRDRAGPGVVELVLNQTGMHRISVDVDDGIVQSQLSSLGLAALVAMLLLMLQFRSLLAGLLGMVPMALTLLVNFGIMGALHIYLEPATVLIASLVVGVGIDYTIHFLSRVRRELARQGGLPQAVVHTQRTAGRAIIINAVTVACGQLVFLAGQLVPLHNFGVLLAVAMVVSALAAVTVLPALLLVLTPRFLER